MIWILIGLSIALIAALGGLLYYRQRYITKDRHYDELELEKLELEDLLQVAREDFSAYFVDVADQEAARHPDYKMGLLADGRKVRDVYEPIYVLRSQTETETRIDFMAKPITGESAVILRVVIDFNLTTQINIKGRCMTLANTGTAFIEMRHQLSFFSFAKYHYELEESNNPHVT